ncbi:MAG TPA: SGNH/GDSL hydrolase family protein [Pseudoneobacillus sp.]|nr:SGNH/GDSL hydrolase family protein [Pseudoneobacillus sp.]
MERAIIFYVISIFFLTSCTMESAVNGEFHVNKKVINLTKTQIPHDFIPQNFTIVSIGDSLTKGVGDSTNRGGYIPYLQSKLEKEKGINKVEFKNYGVKGNKTEDLRNRLNKLEIKTDIKRSDIVIITIGGNDIMKVVKENISHLKKEDFIPAKVNYEKNLNNIIYSIRSINPRIPIVLISLYNPFYTWFADVKEMDEILTEWNKAGQFVMSSYNDTYFVRIDEIFKKTNENLLYRDYFHPNDKGYSLIANRLFITITEKTIKDLIERKYMASKEESK